jgi:hypothetical protein
LPAGASGAGRLCVVRCGIAAAPANVVQRTLRHDFLDQSLVDARAPRGKAAG